MKIAWISAKVAFQRAVLSREITPDMRTVFLYIDEANWYAVAGLDALQQSVAREFRCINVVMAQNAPLLQKALGGDSAKTELEGWTPNFQNIVFCQNNCPVTNAWASQLLGQSMQITMGGGAGGGTFDVVKDWMGKPQEGMTLNWNEQLMAKVRPDEFTRFAKGGDANSYLVQAIIYSGGKRFPTAETFVRTSFNQRI